VDEVVRQPGQFRNPAPHIAAVRVKLTPLKDWIEDPKKSAALAPQPATHCQFWLLLARSASTSVSQNQRSPLLD
jgi:hypothetical protein